MKTEEFLIISKKAKEGFFEYGIRNKKRKAFIIESTKDYPVGRYIYVEFLYERGMYLNLEIL